LGLSFLSGIAVFATAMFVNIKIGTKLKGIRNSFMKSKDQRMTFTNEGLANIKTIKFNSLENQFENEIQNRRINEVNNY